MTTDSSNRPRTKQSDEAFCGSCGEPIKAQAERCPHCGVGRSVRRSSRSSGASGEKDPMVAAIASLFIPGAGDLYNGEVVLGIAAFIGYVTLVTLWSGLLIFIAVITLGIGAILWIFWPLILLLNPLSAMFSYSRAEKINAGEITP